MILRATLLTSMLAFLAFVTLTPTASATCLDTNPDDNGVGTTGCNLPVAGNCHVLVYGSLPGVSPSCGPIYCIRECTPYWAESLVDDLWPPYDCVQDCDGPADS